MESRDNRLIELLEEIRDLQREQYEFAKEHYERTKKLHDQAERIQNRSASMVTIGKRLFMVIVPILIALVAYVSWLLFSVL